MYTQEDLLEVKRQLLMFVVLLGVITLISLGLSAYGVVARINILGMLTSIIWVCVLMFLWGTIGTHLRSYYLFIQDVLRGRRKVTEGVIKTLVKEPILKDNLYFKQIIIEDDDTEMVVYFDVNKPMPDLKVGERVKFNTFGTFVIETLNTAELGGV